MEDLKADVSRLPTLDVAGYEGQARLPTPDAVGYGGQASSAIAYTLARNRT